MDQENDSITLRYEDANDTTGTACIGGRFWTLAYNHKCGDHGMLQAEFIDSTTWTRSDNLTENSINPNADLAQINYRLKF